MIFDPDIDRREARLSVPALSALLADKRRIVIVGARGWIGRTVLDLLYRALGEREFAARVVCFGSATGSIEFGDGLEVPQWELALLSDLEPRPTLLFHLAFLTKDKIAGMDAAIYEAINRYLSRTVFGALDAIGVDRLFVASSGAAGFADDAGASPDMRLYGRLKRADEELFAAWAEADADIRRVAIGRIFSVSGPWMNKHETYALASFILDSLAGRPIEVHARARVLRSYVAVRELVTLVLAALLAEQGAPELRFETGGEALEVGELARRVAQVVGGSAPQRTMIGIQEDRYLGDDRQWRALLARFGLVHLPIEQQIAETAAWLAREVAPIPQPEQRRTGS